MSPSMPSRESPVALPAFVCTSELPPSAILPYDKGCPHGGTNLSAGKRKHLSGGQWHCRFLQRDFDVVYNRTRSRILAEVCSHTQS